MLEANRALRKQIDSLRMERQRFDNLHKKLEKEKQDLQQETNVVIDQSTQAHDQRCQYVHASCHVQLGHGNIHVHKVL